MKKQELWLNLPVKDLALSKAFFSALGFEATRDVPGMVGFTIGGVPVMMVIESDFEQYAMHKTANTENGSELLISVDAPDKAYVDNMVNKVEQAGGKVFFGPELIQGWMYNMCFTDLDGHRWNIVYLNWGNMPKA